MDILIFILLTLIFIETTLILIRLNLKNLFKNNEKRKIYIDTSALIDGRILQVAETGFIGDEIIIPRSVIKELQLLADSKDNDKRTRARAGLDVVNQLERIVHFNTTILQDPLDRTPVDDRLIDLAKQTKGLILTLDFNLAKVAATEKITTLNINDLSLALNIPYQTGDRLTVKLASLGSNPKQAVGNLPDGTMVVVENASHKVGQEVGIKVVRYHQSSSGRILFATLSRSLKK